MTVQFKRRCPPVRSVCRGIVTAAAGALALAALQACAHSAPMQISARDVRDAEEHARRMIQAEASIRADSIPARGVGVTPLRVDPADSALLPLAYALADFIMADLSRSAQLTVVNRLRFDAIIRELELAKTGRLEPATAPRIGKLIGAGRLVTGTIASGQGENLAMGAQVVNSVTGAVRPALTATTTVNQILQAQKDLTFRIFTELGVNLTPAERASVEQFQTRSVAALTSYGRGVQYEADGRFGAAAREFRRAAQIDPSFTMASTRAAAMMQLSASLPLTRVLAMTSESVNRSLFGLPRVEQSGPTDAAFPLQRIIIRVIITTPP